MNHAPDGTPLTIKQLEDMARLLGFSEHDLERFHSTNEKSVLWSGWLEMATRELRFEMMLKGELILRTEIYVASPPKDLKINSWFLQQKETTTCNLT